MSDTFRSEFTGERVIPGQVEDNLFNEHIARYRFAVSLARSLSLDGAFLDAGCGAGYGTLELHQTGAEVLGIDIAEEAIAHARASYARPGIRFEQASCTAIPARDGAFRLIAAFEVIEHLAGWRDFLREARRVLDPGGIFLVSTPNRLYYAESRLKVGPNPFHEHEFTEEEFRSELQSVFPLVRILLQNHVEGIAFADTETDGFPALEIGGKPPARDSAHFFVAVCGIERLPRIQPFVYIPDSGNVLQTREHHIALLNGQIREKQAERDGMFQKVRELETELEEHNRWARQANQEAERRAQLVAQLQEEVRRSNEWAQARDAELTERSQRVQELQAEVARATAWAQARDAELTERAQRVDELQAEVARATAWAQARDAELTERAQRVEQLQAEVARATSWAQERDLEAAGRGRRIEQLQSELAQATEWATTRDAEAEERGARVIELQNELAREQENAIAAVRDMEARYQADMAAAASGYEAAIEQWRRDKEASDRWAMETERRLSAERDDARQAYASKESEFENSLRHIATLDTENQRLQAQLTEAHERLHMIRHSRWLRLGRLFRVGPEIETSQS